MIKDFKIDSQVLLNDETFMPRFGLGVYLSAEGDTCYNAVRHALDVGYRLIDTASFYKNEKSVGKAIRDSGIPREEIFVTTKIWNSDQGSSSTADAFDRSLSQLNIGYIDQYLIHYPVPKKRIETWKVLVELSKTDKVRSIGVSNYMPWHIDEIKRHSAQLPSINQFELSPYCYKSRMDMIAACKLNDIQIESYAPLVRTTVFNEPKLLKIARKYEKTAAQILIRWALQKGIVVIPKSSNPKRISENASVFDFHIDTLDMLKLDAMDCNLLVCWDPRKEK